MTRIGQAASVAVARTAHYRQMMALVATSHLVLTPDTSVTHVASALAKSVIVLFAGDAAGLYGPYGTRGRSISSGGPTLESLEVAPVVGALEDVIMEAWDAQAERAECAHGATPRGRQRSGAPQRTPDPWGSISPSAERRFADSIAH
jgi:Glycosyltransferase family 9 (heptosyltransferase)